VLIGHSMGGLLAKSIAVDSGTKLWDTTFRVPVEALHADDAVRRTFEDALLLKPWPSVGLIIFMGTPQHGSDQADGLLGRLSASLLHLPGRLRESHPRDRPARSEDCNPTSARVYLGPHDQRGISLAPQPLMRAYGGLPIVAGVPSIPSWARPCTTLTAGPRTVTSPWTARGCRAASRIPCCRFAIGNSIGRRSQCGLSDFAGTRRVRAEHGIGVAGAGRRSVPINCERRLY